MSKQKVREEILNKRKSMSLEAVNEKSHIISNFLQKSTFYKEAFNIMAYIDFRNEVRTKNIIETSLSYERNIIIPISIPDTRELVLSKLEDYDKELESGTYGILEPKKEYIREVSPNTIDLVLIPGVAFDKRGYRIGYGAGYYDRFLKKIKRSVPRVALAFDLQMVSYAYEGKHDEAVDYIITESGIIKC